MIAAFLNNIVPYHHARWNGYAGLHAAECLLIEITNRDAFHILEYDRGNAVAYKRVTLFPGESAAKVSKTNLRRAVRRILDEHRPKWVCLNGYSFFYNWVALDWCCRHGVPAIVCSESNEFDEPRRPWKEAVKRFFIRHCAAGLAGGRPQADYLVRLGMLRERIFLGYDAVDNDYFELGAEEAKGHDLEIRKKHGLPERYFIACARFTPKKNLPRLIEAYARYRKLCSSRTAPWDLVILGDGGGREKLLALHSTLGLEKHLHLVGAKPYEDLPAYYGLASAFIHASTTEQWGLVVNEAMASGLPVLVSNRCGCAQDLVKEGVNGFTFDPYNVEDIAEKMLQVSASDEQLSAFGRASRKIIADWSPRRFAEGLSQAIEVALSSPVPRSSGFNQVLLWMLARR